MATEEEESDVSLKEIVQQTLEARGLFASIRAQLLASVFEVFEDSSSSHSDPINPTLHRFLSSSDGRLLLSLVKEFLDFFCLEASSSVLVTETAFQDFETREQLCGAFHLDNEGVDDDLDSVSLLQYLVEGRRGVGSIDDSGASGTSSRHLHRRGAPIPITISTPIQPPPPKNGFSSSRGFDDSSNHGNGPSSASPSLDLGPAANLKESNFSNHSSTSSNAAAAAAKTSKIPVPSSPTATTSNPSSNGGAKKENALKESSPSGIPRVKSSSSVSSNSSSSGSDRAATPKVSNDDDHIEKTTKKAGNSSHSNSQKETTAKMNGFYDENDDDNSNPHHQSKKASNNDKVKPEKSQTKDNDDDFDLGDFVTNDNDDDFYDDDDDLFGLGVGKKDKKNERHTSFPSRRRQDEGGGGSKKVQSKSDDVDENKSEKNGNDFLSDLPPLKSRHAVGNEPSSNRFASGDQNKKGKPGGGGRSDWLDELGFANDDDDAFGGGGGGGSGSDNNNKSESSSRRSKKSEAESSKGKLSSQKENDNAQRRNNNNGAATEGEAKGKNLIGGSGGGKDLAMGSKTAPSSKERKKAFDSNSEVSEIAESVEEFSFESDEDITTDKTFSDPDNALKKLDYTENVGAVIYETL